MNGMRNIILFILVLFTAVLSAQPVNQTDEDGRKQGVWRKHFKEGGIRYEGEFKDDVEVGVFKFYYPDGTVAAIKTYDGTTGNCEAKMFHLKGQLASTGFYKGREKDGEWNYYNEEGQHVAVEHYQNGVLHGESKTFYSDGTVASAGNYENGKMVGEWRDFYETQQLKTLMTYEDGRLHGVYKDFDIDGAIRSKGKYQNGFKEGIWILYDANGTPEMKEVYKRGELESSEEL